ncbi:ArnT family glycosyltransferase [Paraburkholderia bannensis]|uniref:ArnT family glycosyltransferase n=1 Tax=Paraburkholderia bannensis TaxID=765414 RepID=UPI002ABD2D4E|nr:glycosyltransferase family 39 protein [Paraburkholderia bannensis]
MFGDILATRIAFAFAILLLGMSAWLAFQYSSVPLLGSYGFRETQTALTAYWTCKAGFHGAFWTPVAGYPWAIPFEFPIYQWVVAAIGCPMGVNLDPVGRIVSYAFWIACLWPAWRISRRLFDAQAKLYFWVFAALFLSSPLYLLYGRSFMVETAALFFSLSFLACAIEMSFGNDRWIDALTAGIFLTLAILQKSTTALPLMLLGVVYLWKARSDILRNFHRAPMLYKGITAYVIPFVIGVAWVKFSDHAKMANAMGSFLTSDALRGWNFGTLQARYSKELWVDVIWNRVIGENIAGHFGAIAIIVGLVCAPKRRILILASVALYLTYFMAFEHLLFLHKYYPLSNTVYVIFATSVSLAALIEYRANWTPVVIVALAGILIINLNVFFSDGSFAEESRQFSDNYQLFETTRFVRDHTASDAELLVYGDDWNSEIPYYSQRKSFNVGGFFKPYFHPLESPGEYLDKGVGALLICNDARQDKTISQSIDAKYATWQKTSLQMCDIYLPK